LYTSGIDATPIPALCSTDIVLVLAKYKNYDDSRKVVVCSALLPYNSAVTPPSIEMAEVSLSLFLLSPGKQLVLSLMCVDFQMPNLGVRICWNTSAVWIKFPK
jgi:hypothetical protein